MAGIVTHAVADSDRSILDEAFMRMRQEKKMRRRGFPIYIQISLIKGSHLRLFTLVHEKLKHMTDRNDSVPSMDQLLPTLKYFASCIFLLLVGDFIGIGKGTASRIIKRMCTTLDNICKKQFC